MPAWITLAISIISGLIPLATQIGKLWESSAGFSAIATTIANSPIITQLEAIGAQMFPQAAKSIQAVLAAIHLGYKPATQWVQMALNAGQSLGYISFGNGVPLTIDGIFGPKTMAAVVALQTKLGLHTTGAVADAEYGALNLLITGKLPS